MLLSVIMCTIYEMNRIIRASNKSFDGNQFSLLVYYREKNIFDSNN